MMKEHFIKVTNVSKSFAGVQALKNVNITIKRGEIRCLAGENGSGKSTLIKIISGAHAPDEGDIEINGKHYKRLHPIEAIREGIQVIYQDFSIFPNLTAAENIALNCELAKNRRFVNWKRVKSIAKEAISKIGVDIDLGAKVENLSVADKQLIAISRALLQNARLIIMDEPTTALTQKEVNALFKVVKSLQQKGISILFVSHKLDEVFDLAEKITILRNGQNVIDGDTSEFNKEKFVYYMTGRKISEKYYEPQQQSNQCLLKVEKLSRKGSFYDISFSLYSGEILGITGLLGSGRTELALALFGLNTADSGKVYVENRLTEIKTVQDAIKSGIAYVPEDRLTEGLFLQQSIGRNIIISTLEKVLNKYKLIDGEKMSKQTNHWIKELNIVTPSAHLPVQSLSGGNQQRVVLAKWLATNPKILILNGPTVGVDIGSKADIHQIIRELAQRGVGVIMISDDIPELLQNCNRILIMRKGQIVGEFRGKSITEEEISQQLSAI